MFSSVHSLNVLNISRKLSAINRLSLSTKPRASEVLTTYLTQCQEPPWTAFFVKYNAIVDDQWSRSHFNWPVGESNYHILRTGCYPYIKYHCTKRQVEDLTAQDKLFRVIKILNFGIPCLAYGLAAICLVTHKEVVHMPHGEVTIYFWYKEDKGSLY